MRIRIGFIIAFIILTYGAITTGMSILSGTEIDLRSTATNVVGVLLYLIMQFCEIINRIVKN